MAMSAPAARALARSPEYLMPPSAITGTLAFLRRLDTDNPYRGELRHADAGDNAGGADRPWTDTDLDRVGARIDQGLRTLHGGDVAGDDLHGIGEPLDAVDGCEHPRGMAVRGIHHDHVDARVDQPLGTL